MNMKEGLTILFLWLIVIGIGYLLFKEVEQEMIRFDACNNYSLSTEDYNILCKQPK